MTAYTNANRPQKICPVCARPFAWRKKWRNNWHRVKYCSKACKKQGATQQ